MAVVVQQQFVNSMDASNDTCMVVQNDGDLRQQQ